MNGRKRECLKSPHAMCVSWLGRTPCCHLGKLNEIGAALKNGSRNFHGVLETVTRRLSETHWRSARLQSARCAPESALAPQSTLPHLGSRRISPRRQRVPSSQLSKRVPIPGAILFLCSAVHIRRFFASMGYAAVQYPRACDSLRLPPSPRNLLVEARTDCMHTAFSTLLRVSLLLADPTAVAPTRMCVPTSSGGVSHCYCW